MAETTTEYLARLMSEIEAEGVDNPTIKVTMSADNPENDNDLRIIERIEKATGTDFSYEQKKILRHRGSAVVLACAGAGKTQTSVALITKRILSGEVNPEKMLYATYSKSGANEMTERLQDMLAKLGVHKKVQVRTLHSFFLSILRTLGNNMDTIDAGMQRRFLVEACKEADMSTDPEDVTLVGSLLSYQINNLLTDKKVIESYVNTLENLTPEIYSKIRMAYARKKKEANVMDFDDMQFSLFTWIYNGLNSSDANAKNTAIGIINYCKAMYDSFFIDEAQDVSKIQFAIIRALVTEFGNDKKLDRTLVFIGDDDQCLPGETQVMTLDGFKRIDKIRKGDKVYSVNSDGDVVTDVVNAVSSKPIVNSDMVTVKTKSGNVLVGTDNHICFAKMPDKIKYESNVCFVALVEPTGTSGMCLTTLNRDRFACIKDKIYRAWIIDSVKSEFDAIVRTAEYSKKFHVPFMNLSLNISPTVRYYDSYFDKHGEENKSNALKMLSCLNIDFTQPIIINSKSIRCGHVVGENKYFETSMSSLRVGFEVPSVDKNGKPFADEIVSIEIEKQTTNVYDISVLTNHNFVANGVVVHNCIYQWRGSDPSVILSIGALFNIDTFVLSKNYRCKNEVVDFAARGIACNNIRYSKSMEADQTGGTVKILQTDKEDLCTLSTAAFRHIKYWLDAGEKPGDIAILCRNNVQLAILNNMLLNIGEYTVCTNEMLLTRSTYYKDIRALVDASTDCWDSNVTERILWKLCRYMSRKVAKVIAEFQSGVSITLRQALGYVLKSTTGEYIVFNDNIKVPIQTQEKLQYALRTVNPDTVACMVSIYNILTSCDEVDTLKALCVLYLTTTDGFLYKTEEKKREIQGMLKYIVALSKNKGYNNLLAYLNMTERYEKNPYTSLGNQITMTTMHSAKGREWKNVIIFGADNVSQLSLEGILKMKENDSKVEINDIFNHIDEERRLNYVACTRAKENLVLVCGGTPSMFIVESLGGSTDSCNKAIFELALNRDLIKNYEDTIKQYVTSNSSKYHYNPAEFGIQDDTSSDK